jgi:hypothetical protein
VGEGDSVAGRAVSGSGAGASVGAGVSVSVGVSVVGGADGTGVGVTGSANPAVAAPPNTSAVETTTDRMLDRVMFTV